MNQVSHVIEVILFRSRFLLAPLYLGLVGTLILLTYRFIVEFIHMFEKVGEKLPDDIKYHATNIKIVSEKKDKPYRGYYCC